jgi:hypothetical protein
MLKAGIPEAAVKHKMVQEGLDPAEYFDAIKDPDGQKPIKDHPKYAPYFKMLHMGLPKGAVAQKLKKEGLDPKIIDLQPDTPAYQVAKLLKPEVKMCKAKEHPIYGKFFKMMAMGLPKGAVENGPL